MLITKEFLEEEGACSDGYEWSLKQKNFDKGIEAKKFIKLLLSDDKWTWANWLIVRVMDRKQYLQYAIFAAEQVIDVYEKKYPDNKKPREAIKAAKKVLADDTSSNRRVATAAYAAATADAVYDAADATVASAYAAAYAAYAAAYAYAAYAYASAYAAADASRNKMRTKLINYGLKLLK